MSIDPKRTTRYTASGLVLGANSPEAWYVLADDFDALAAEVERRKALAREVDDAAAEVERLREALRTILGPDPTWDEDGQHDYGFRTDGPFAPRWVRDIANDALTASPRETG